MKDRNQRLFLRSTAGATLLFTSIALAQSDAENSETDSVYKPLGLENRALHAAVHTNLLGSLQLGLDYSNDENFMFGQYSGLNENGSAIIGAFNWQDFSGRESSWQITLSDLGLDTREGEVIWRRGDRLRLKLAFDSQLQVRNNSGSTPFRGADNDLRLPDNWVAGLITSDWSNLDSSLQQFDQTLARDKFSLGLDLKLNDNWRIETALSYEDKRGTQELGAAIYGDAASGDSVLLPAPVDYRSTEFTLGLLYSGEKLHLEGRVGYSKFDNQDQWLQWQNPYSSFGSGVQYPLGIGALGLAPDNEQTRLRLTGRYVITPTSRLQLDGSYAIASQDQRYLDYSVNPSLNIDESLPRDRYDGEVAISTFNGHLLLRPLRKFNVDAFFKLRSRDYDVQRDAWRYVRGDGADQPRAALSVYNSAKDYLVQTTGLELSYRLPLRSRLRFEYAFETVERENAAVEDTEEDRYLLGYRIQPWSNFTAHLKLTYGNRQAGTYQWDQSYFALLDTELINLTPDSQRYINHPLLSQYHLANREQLESKLDFSYLPTDRWNLSLNLMSRDTDYDKSELGLTKSQWQRFHLSASYTASDAFTASIYAGLDRHDSDQGSRAFRGGPEKNAFELYTPVPQASDPTRDWDLDTGDSSLSFGASMQWRVFEDVELALNYNFVDAEAEQAFKTYGAVDLVTDDLPPVETQMHHLTASSTWQLKPRLAIKFDYQYYKYRSDDWARQGVLADSIDKVLTFGERNPNEQIHYLGASVIYRWE